MIYHLYSTLRAEYIDLNHKIFHTTVVKRTLSNQIPQNIGLRAQHFGTHHQNNRSVFKQIKTFLSAIIMAYIYLFLCQNTKDKW